MRGENRDVILMSSLPLEAIIALTYEGASKPAISEPWDTRYCQRALTWRSDTSLIEGRR